MKNILVVSIFSFCIIQVWGQSKDNALFSTADPLDISFNLSIKTIKNAKTDTVYFNEKLYYRNAAGTTDSIKIGLKRRGNYRLKECYFPPLWMKIEKKNSKNTLFDGNKKLKLVLPCDNAMGSNNLILREYLCYKLYEATTPFAFETRLVNIHLTEEKGKKNKEFDLKGILIEDINKAAKRCGGKVPPNAAVAAVSLNDTCALRFDFFQLLIANTDWSKGHQHNSKLIYKNSKFIPLPYDFDMSGVVDAPYAVVSQVGNEELPIETVTERYYRGYCSSPGTTEFVRREFLSKEEKLLAVPDMLKSSLSDRDIASLKDYLKEFFNILKDDDLFRREVIERCREK